MLGQERLFERRVAEAGQDFVALRGLVEELKGCGEPWAGPMRLRLSARVVQLRAEDEALRKLGDFWSRYKVAPPDGRPLYAYRLSDEGFARLAEDVRGQAQAGALAAGFAPAQLVLWASEWFRRAYRGDGQRWEALERALGVAVGQSLLRDVTERGLKLWRRKLRMSLGGDRQFLATLACEGGFPAAAVEEGGRGWARDLLRAVVAPLLGGTTLDIDQALELARGQVERLPQTFRDEEFLALCAELAIAVVRLRREAEAPAAAQGIPAAAWLTINRPEWREDLPITTEGASAAALIDVLMTVEAQTIGRGAVRVERLLERTETGWREALRLELDGLLTGEAVAGLDASLGRLRAHAHGALARALPGELALVEPPAIGEAHWTVRAITRSRGVKPVPFAVPIELDLRAGERPVRRIAIPGGAARRGALLVCTIAESSEDAPRLLKVEGSGSGGFQADAVIVQAPADWPVEVLEGEVVDIGPGIGTTRLWRIAGRAWAISGEGDRYLIRTGQTATAKDRIELIGQRPAWARIEGEIDLFCGAPVVRRSGPQRGGLYIRRIGSREWRAAPSPLPIGHYEIGWREDRVLLDRRRIAVLPAAAKLDCWGRGATTGYRPDGFGSCVLVPEQGAPIVAQADGSWRARPVKRPTHRFRATVQWPESQTNPPLEVAIDFPADAAIAHWDGTVLPNGTRLIFAELRDLVALDRDHVQMFGELLLPDTRVVAETMSWTVNREMAMSVAAPDIASMLLPAPIDATVRLGMHDGIETYWHVAQFAPKLVIEGDGLVAPYGIAVPGAEVCARAFADPTRELSFGPYSLVDDANHRPIRLPASLPGLWLVYLRRGGEVLTRPTWHRGQGGAMPPRTPLGRAMVLSPGHGLDEALTDLFDTAEGEGAEALALIAELNALTASLAGLPPRTFRVLELVAERPAVLARMAMLASEAERDAVLALSDALPFAWCLIPQTCWEQAQRMRLEQALAMLAGVGGRAAEWAMQMVGGSRDALIAREPLLGPTLAPQPMADDLRAIVQAFLNRAVDRVDGRDGSCFRPRLAARLPRWFLDLPAHCLETLDAPCAAALAVRGEWRPDLTAVRRIKAVARSFPNFFGDAFAVFLQECA